MINGLEGIPGSGKSYEAVTFHVLPSLANGRLVITNLPLLVDVIAAINPEYRDLIELRTQPRSVLGTWDPARVDDKGNGNAFELFTDGAVSLPVASEKQPSTFGHVWDYYSDWKHPVTGQGPVFLIDECHVAMPAFGTDPQVVEWFKLHRHFNADVLLATQSFRDMNQPIARLIAMLVKCRKADILGKPDHYIRKVHAGYRGAVISTEERKYKPEYFKLYKSHSQGNSVAESAAGDVQPMIVKFKRFSRIFYVITVLVCVYAAWRIANPIAKPVRVKNTVHATASTPAPALPLAAPVQALVLPAQTMIDTPPDVIPEPYASKGLHVTGRLVMGARVIYTFAVSSGTMRQGQITSDDLRALGYVWQPLTDCAGTLRWKTSAKSLTCDAPAVPEGSSTNPVVITVPAGSTTPSARSDAHQVAAR